MVHGIYQFAGASEQTAGWSFEHVFVRYTSGIGLVTGYRQRGNKLYRTYFYRCRGVGALINSSNNEIDLSASIQCGGDGVTVCDEWRNSFEAFYRDMGSKPSALHSIDRKDSAKSYCKDNCRWATPIEQANNISTNVYYKVAGERKTLAEWCREFEVNYKTMHSLLRRSGFEFEDALERVLEIKRMKK